MTQLSLMDTEWVQSCSGIVLDQMRDVAFTSDELHSILPEPMHQNEWGALLATLRPKLEKIGYRPSTRPARNGGVVAVWRVKP